MNSVNNNRRDEKSLEELTTQHEITGLIISAGFSQRMGKFKPLLNFNGKTFLRNITEKLSVVCSEIVIVTGYNTEVIEKHLITWEEHLANKIKIVYNDKYERGMFTSLKLGAEHCNTDWVFYHFVDQPNLPNNFYTEFIKVINAGYDWIQPVFNNKKGHPILFNKNVIKLINQLEESSSLKKVSSNTEVRKKYWECNYSQILTDFDTPEDLTELSGY